MVSYSHLFQNFPQFLVVHTVKSFGIDNKAETEVVLEFSSFFDDSVDVDSVISGSFAFSKTNLNIWKFKVNVLLKPGFEYLVVISKMRESFLFITKATIQYHSNPRLYPNQ